MGRQYRARFLRNTLDLMRATPNVQRELVYLPDDAATYFQDLAPDFQLSPQQGAELGERLDNLLSRALATGATVAVVMDNDSPTLPVPYLAAALALHAGADVVLGTCDDGGYYLIGLRQPQSRLLREVPMSIPTVLADTLAIARELDLNVALLPTWYDVDTVVELTRLRQELSALEATVAKYTRTFLAQMNFANLNL